MEAQYLDAMYMAGVNLIVMKHTSGVQYMTLEK